MAKAVLPPSQSGVFRIVIRLIKGNASTQSDAIKTPGEIWKRVEDIFTQFCRRGTSQAFSRAEVLWVEDPVDPGDLQPHELLAYLVPTKFLGLIRTHYSGEFPKIGDKAGATVVKAGKNLSEVYFLHKSLNDDPEHIADVVIHELMHNKLNMDDDMHDEEKAQMDGFAREVIEQPSLGTAMMLGPHVTASGTDIRLMNPALARPMPQLAGL